MKSSLTPAESPKTFQPFTLHLTAETIEEARLLYHICNHANLIRLIKADDEKYGFMRNKYSEETDE